MVDESAWDPQAIVHELTPQPFPPEPEPDEPAGPQADEGRQIERQFGMTPRTAATLALGKCRLFTPEEQDQLELAARGVFVEEHELFKLIHRFFDPPKR